MIEILNKLSISYSIVIKILAIFFITAFIFGNVLRVGAVNFNPADTKSVIPKTPADQTIGNFQSSDEIDLSLSADAPCRGKWNSRLGGIIGSIIDFGNDMFVTDAANGTCATIAFNNGDPRMLASILNQEDSTSLVENILSLNAKVLDQRPASGIHHIESQVYALFNSQSVSAQQDDVSLYYRGTGFALLQPVQAFWGWSVNIVYALLILIIIIVALGIIFRSSLSGGLAVALQQAIPNIALAMILVPLSYAITGLFIDGITIGVNTTHQFLLGPGAPGRGVYEARNEDFPTDGRFGGVVPYNFEDRGLHADDMRVSWLYSGQVLVTGEDSLGAGVSSLAEGVGLIFGISSFLESLGIGHWFIPIINFILGVILLFTGLRIFGKLLVKYILFILMPIFAPFIFAGIALPGSGVKLLLWYGRIMASASLFYIVAYAMTLLAIIFSSSYFFAQLPSAGINTFVPPLTGLESALVSIVEQATTQNSGLSAADNLLQFTFVIVAFGIYMLIPKSLDNINTALNVGALPEFFGDIIQSTRDSIGLARTTGNLGARAYGSDLNLLRADKRIKAKQTLGNLVDIGRGVRPGEDGSFLERRRARLQSRLANVEAKRKEALEKGQFARASLLNRQASSIKSQLGSTDSAFAGDGGKTEGPNKLEAKISWAGSDSLMVVDGALISALRSSNPPTLQSGSISIVSDVPFFPARNAPTGGRRVVAAGSSTVASLMPRAITEVPAEYITILNRDVDVDGVRDNEPFKDYFRGQNLFQLAGLPPRVVRFYIVGNRGNVGQVDEDRKTIKMRIIMQLTRISLDDFLNAVGSGATFQAENKIQFEIKNAFGLGTTMRTNKVSFNIQPQFRNITGLAENPTHTVP